MHNVKIYHPEDISRLTRKRSSETKIGEQVKTIQNRKDWLNELQRDDIRFVLLGIPEDIGVRANYGRGGSHTAWIPALDSFLSQQSNYFLKGDDILVLGHIDVEEWMHTAESITGKSKKDIDQLRELTAKIDDKVSETIKHIIEAKKIPIIIGGGHNNAYGNIKGTSQALQQKINVINCDAHSDFRSLEGRHSGNGFSYAFHEGYLEKYSLCCMHEQYNNQSTLEEFTQHNDRLYYSTYEDVFIKERYSFAETINRNISFVKGQACGLEIDLDAITNVPSSAKTSSGLSPIQARQYVYQSALQLSPSYFHIAEGAPILSHIKADNKTGKLIAYLISDFIKGILDSVNQ